ncbi:MAG: hypothetical protein EZS28_029882 [Streblomastix strix]|uniref:Uncharacterized protein n=1 Tax=Streblomastix strix TaxID=222440 RepID=A0A5J4UWY5_9EUKA|nr:MAG: hypothetical protein EZS28_029882 [Streblomastix strix]
MHRNLLRKDRSRPHTRGLYVGSEEAEALVGAEEETLANVRMGSLCVLATIQHYGNLIERRILLGGKMGYVEALGCRMSVAGGGCVERRRRWSFILIHQQPLQVGNGADDEEQEDVQIQRVGVTEDGESAQALFNATKLHEFLSGRGRHGLGRRECGILAQLVTERLETEGSFEEADALLFHGAGEVQSPVAECALMLSDEMILNWEGGRRWWYDSKELAKWKLNQRPNAGK